MASDKDRLDWLKQHYLFYDVEWLNFYHQTIDRTIQSEKEGE